MGTDSCIIYVSFYAPEAGSLSAYIGDDQIGRMLEWNEPTQFRDRGWVYDFGPGEDLGYVKANLRLAFSMNFDPVRVDH